MNGQLERIDLLLHQSRFDLAETECRRALGADPNSAWATALLALSLSGQKKHKEATKAAQSAIALEPDWGFAHYTLASILDDRDRLDEAKAAIAEAIRLDPEDPDYFALLAGLHTQRQQWTDGLKAAERGLALDAEHVQSANIRAMCLVKLGRKTEADAAIAAALAREPENAVTHANRGWTLLESGDHQKAMVHFHEALRLDPEMEWARAGIVEAMKARRWIYRTMLKYFFFMSHLSSRTRWLVIIGAVIGIRLLKGIKNAAPAAAPFIAPIIFLYLVFVLMTWIAEPLFNLLLRLDKFGRLALSRDQTQGANLVGLCLLCSLLSFSVAPWFTWVWGALGAAVFGMLLIPVSAVFECDKGWPRVTMAAYTLLLAVLGLGSWVGSMVVLAAGGAEADFDAVGNTKVFGVFFLGAVLSTWIGMALSAAKVRK